MPSFGPFGGITDGAITDGALTKGAVTPGAVTSTGSASLLVNSVLGQRTLSITAPVI